MGEINRQRISAQIPRGMQALGQPVQLTPTVGSNQLSLFPWRSRSHLMSRITGEPTKSLCARRVFKRIAELVTPMTHDYEKWERKNRWLRRAGLNIARDGVAIDIGFACLTGLEENITILDYTAIGMKASFWNFGHISIGKFCMFAAEVTLSNGGHNTETLEPFSGPLTIGSGCWFGTKAQVVGPLTIGNNVIVGAGAVVVDDVESDTIVAGVPARPIRKRKLSDRAWHLGNVYFNPQSFDALKTCA